MNIGPDGIGAKIESKCFMLKIQSYSFDFLLNTRGKSLNNSITSRLYDPIAFNFLDYFYKLPDYSSIILSITNYFRVISPSIKYIHKLRL